MEKCLFYLFDICRFAFWLNFHFFFCISIEMTEIEMQFSIFLHWSILDNNESFNSANHFREAFGKFMYLNFFYLNIKVKRYFPIFHFFEADKWRATKKNSSKRWKMLVENVLFALLSIAFRKTRKKRWIMRSDL